MAKKNGTLDRRGFLRGAAAGAAAGAAFLITTEAPAEARRGDQALPDVLAPTQEQIARDAEAVQPPAMVRAVQRPGSDLMVQVLKDMNLEYLAANPGSSFEGLQESLVNYGNPPNRTPEYITALHEESAVTMAHGYGKAEGRPMVALLHGTIGIQHAAMSIYQAYYDQTPVLILAGRDQGFIAAHTANDMAAMVRSFTKWDAQPKTLEESLTALQRAYNEAITPPMGPTLVVLDTELQKEEAHELKVPDYRPPQISGIGSSHAAEIAKALLAAQNPMIMVGRLRTPVGVKAAVELAELVGACTSTAATNGPMSFPQRHPLCGRGVTTSYGYDYILGLETQAKKSPLESGQTSIIGPGLATLLSRDTAGVGFGGIAPGSGTRANAGGAAAQNNSTIQGDAEASLPVIIEEVKRQLTADQRRLIDDRKAKIADANQKARVEALTKAVQAASDGWASSPVSTARIYAELWPLIKNEDWCLASPSAFSGGHNAQLWDHNKPYSYLGGQGAGGMGYGAPASVGAALAAKSRNRIVINIQTDGDLNYAPGILWTAVHHKLPMLTIMHNNRAWHQELMFLEYMCGVRGRGTDRGSIGTSLRDPFINYAKMAAAYGMASEGPISDPTKLTAAFKRGVDSAKRGEPYMIDVLTQPR